MTTLASGSQRGIYYIEETTFNTPPADAELKPLRNTGGALKLDVSTKTSAELRPDRQKTNVIYGAKSASGEIPFEFSAQSFDDLIQAALMGAWDSGTVKTGKTYRSFSILENFSDINESLLTTGCAINSLKITVTPDEATGSVSIVGKDRTDNLAALGTPTYATPLTTTAFDGFTGDVLVDGTSVGTVTQIEVTIENGMADRPVIGNAALEQSVGSCNVTGSMTLHFENLTMYNKFANGEAITVRFNLTDGTDGYSFFLPKVFLTDYSNDVGGEGDIFINPSLQAVYESTEDATLTVTKT